MVILSFIPFAAMLAIIVATILRGFTIRQRKGDRPLAFLSATGVQRIAGLSFAISTIVLIAASVIAAQSGGSRFSLPAAIFAIMGTLPVIVAQVQMGRAWRIGGRKCRPCGG